MPAALWGKLTLVQLVQYVIVHPDQITHWKSQVLKSTAAAFIAGLKHREFAISMDGRGAWRDNAFIITFN